jgi:hypothetical protein
MKLVGMSGGVRIYDLVVSESVYLGITDHVSLVGNPSTCRLIPAVCLPVGWLYALYFLSVLASERRATDRDNILFTSP